MMVVFEGVKVALARMLLRICSHFRHECYFASVRISIYSAEESYA